MCSGKKSASIGEYPMEALTYICLDENTKIFYLHRMHD